MSETTSQPWTFEQSLTALEQIVHDLEDGQIGLDASLTRYEQGVGLLKNCYAHLRQAEQKILALTGQDEQGQPTLQPFEHAATAESGKTDARRRRPSGSPSPSPSPDNQQKFPF